MKSLYLLFITFSLSAFANGKLTLEPSYDPSQDKSHVVFGLGVYEMVGKNMAYNSWTGMGDSFDVDSSYHDWYSTRHQIDFDDGKGLVFSPGVRLSYLDHDYDPLTQKKLIPEVYGKVSVEIW